MSKETETIYRKVKSENGLVTYDVTHTGWAAWWRGWRDTLLITLPVLALFLLAAYGFARLFK